MNHKTRSTDDNEKARETASRGNKTAKESAHFVPQSDFRPETIKQAAGNLAIQRAAERIAAEPDDGLSQRIRAASAGGSSLDDGVRSRFERGLDASLLNVRVHTDGEADQLAQSVNAAAFTSGQDIFFRAGAYNPTSQEGVHLLAHEAAHVVQQEAGPVAGSQSVGGTAISDPSDSFEQAAEQSANRLMAGIRAPSHEVSHSLAQEARPTAGTSGHPKAHRASGSTPHLQRQGGGPIPPNINPFGSTFPPAGPTPLAPSGPTGPVIPKAPTLPNIPEPPPGGFPKLPPSPATGAVAPAAEAALSVDLAGVATSAAAVILPLATAVVIGYGLFQASKLAKAAVAAANAGVAARTRAKTAAEGYARVMTGGASKGDEGSAQAEAQIASIMAKTNASRDQVVEAVKSQQGGYSAIYQKNLKRIKDYLYAEAVRVFEETHQNDFGIIESFGETWGMRGEFRSTLRLVLYGED